MRPLLFLRATGAGLRIAGTAVIGILLSACVGNAADSIQVANPSFQADVFSTFPGYRGGANPIAITGWGGGGGINGADIGAGVPFANNGAITDGTRVAFIQGPGALTQTLGGFTVGEKYWVQVWTNARACCGDVPQVSVSLGGTQLLAPQSLTPVGGAAPYYLANFTWTATSTSALLSIGSAAAVGGDATAVFDAIAVVRRGAGEVVIANPSFEASGQGLAFPGYYTNIAGWERFVVLGNTGINTSAGPFHDNGVVPDGLNILLLQNSAGVQQSVAGLEAGRTYRLTLRYNARAGTGQPQFRVKVDGQTALDAPVAPVGPSQPYHALTFDFTASAETAALVLENRGIGADTTVLVDDVHLAAIGAPVPPALALPSPGVPGGAVGIVTINEIHYNPAGAAPEWVEIVNQGSLRVDLSGWKITGGIDFTFADGTVIEPGAYRVISSSAGDPAGALGPFTGSLDGSGDTVRLRTRQGWLMDEVTYGVANDWPTAPDGAGPSLAKRATSFASDTAASWVASTQIGGTPGAVNFLMPPALAVPAQHVAGPVVINEIFYHARPTFADGATPFSEDTAEWIELHNRSAASVDISGWRLDDAVSHTFPPGTTLAPGAFLVVSNAQFSGSLSNSGDSIKLRDAADVQVDKVRYRDGGRWPAYADGGGASLELSDPAADNTKPEAWAASDESAKLGWQNYSYTASGAEPPNANNPAVWREFLLGTLDAGEVLIDDISVRKDPTGTNEEVIQNGTFEADAIGQPPAKWRCLGTHKQSVVVQDPSGPGKVLKVVATGEIEHTYNNCSTTLVGNQAIDPAKNYTVSFRAKWLAGSPQLHTRLYLNRAACTTILPQPATAGTPGAVNSRRIANAGPTFSDFVHAPLVPALGQPVTVFARPFDPNGVGAVSLFYSVNGAAFQEVAMTNDGSGIFSAQIPGQPMAGFVVQFYVQAADVPGATSTFPARGVASRAMYRVGDGGVTTQAVANKLRLLMTPADAAAMHAPIHAVSNARWGATLIANDREVFYDIKVRLRSSPYGRQGNRTGWNIDFDPEQPFRGTETDMVLDGAFNMPRGDGTGWIETTLGPSVNEMLYIKIAERAGDVPTEHEDVAYVQTPFYESRRCQLRLRRYSNAALDDFTPNGGDGSLFKQEIIYHPTSTVDGNPESLKNPYSTFTAVDITDHGADRNAYRFNYLLRNHRDRDDFAGIIAMGATFSGANFYADAEATLDLDNWARVLALNALTGLADTYNQSLPHNMQFLARPGDGRVMLFPWDLDHAFYFATNFNIYGGNAHRVKDLIADPRMKRRLAGHLLDFCNTSFSNSYLDPWIDHFVAVSGKANYSSNFKNWVSTRRTFVLNQLATDWPATPFAITTNGGADFSAAATSAMLQGNGWINEKTIRRAGAAQPLAVTWISGTAWQVTVPLAPGANVIALEAVDQQGTVVGSDSITIISTTPGNLPAAAGNLVISEIMYHPAAPSAAEQSAGFTDKDDFEFIELENISASTLELGGAAFTVGITHTFPASTLAPGARLILVRNAAAFAQRYGAGVPVAGTYSGALSNGGERLLLLDRDTFPILDFTYGDSGAWPAGADGSGFSLVLKNPASLPDATLPANWRTSAAVGGNPGGSDALSAASFPGLLDYALVGFPVATLDGGFATFTWRERIGADGATITPQLANLPPNWAADPGDASLITILENTANPDGSRTIRARATAPAASAPHISMRLRVTTP